MAKSKRVLVLFRRSNLEDTVLLRGIADFARQRGNWLLHVSPGTPGLAVRDLLGWPGDGLIAALFNRREVASARHLGLPVVNLSGAIRDADFPRVMVDHEQLGRLAAGHLLACGLRRFAYYGESEMWYSQQRKRGFLAGIAPCTRHCSVLDSAIYSSRRNPWHRWIEPIEKWLRTLQPPVGLMAVHDYAAMVIVETCLRLGLRVPDDVAVIGVGNDRLTCEMCAVPLSSVARSNWEVGYRAAAVLDRLMSGKAPPKQGLLVRPEGVVRRRSTDVVHVDDPPLAAAVKYMREHAGEHFQIGAVLKNISVSRRLLEIHCRKHLHCTPQQYLRQMRVERAKQLLSRSAELKLQQIARMSGFTSARHFRDAFQRVTGTTPARYRLRLTTDSSTPAGR